MSELSTRLRLRRKELGLSQEELAQRMGYRSKSSITKLEKGVNDLPQAKLEELAAALETTPAYLLGLDAPCPPPGFEPLPAMVRVPLIGSIACGTPITAEQNVERYIGVPAAWRADFALTCHGNSMSPTICDGDIVCGASFISPFKASVVFPLERASSIFPTVISARIIAADSK